MRALRIGEQSRLTKMWINPVLSDDPATSLIDESRSTCRRTSLRSFPTSEPLLWLPSAPPLRASSEPPSVHPWAMTAVAYSVAVNGHTYALLVPVVVGQRPRRCPQHLVDREIAAKA